MEPSARFGQLNNRLTELKDHFIPTEFSPTGDYDDKEQDLARGYRLLVHAEIESYLEDVARETVTEAITKWKTEQKASIVIVSFLAAYHSSWSVTDQISNEDIIEIARSRKNAKDSINEVIDLAQRQFVKKLRDNHGVKDKNFKTLILPAGVDIEELDQTWLTNLDSFGEKRGEIAHRSKHTQGAINPKDEYELVQNLLAGLRDLDLKINQVTAP